MQLTAGHSDEANIQMSSKVLWEIDNELDGRTFERLCIDLLHRNGYLDIVPVEPQDGGRDAQEVPRKGRAGEGHPTFFQFSMETKWKSKLRSDAKKLKAHAAEFDTFVFVTNRAARGVDVDLLRTEFRKEYGWNLFVYSREWLRLQLEEVHPDLATKYLGADNHNYKSESAAIIELDETIEEQLRHVKETIDNSEFDLSIAQLKRFLILHPGSSKGFQLLAWSYYRLDRFDEALSAVNRAIKCGGDAQSTSVKACILAEKGIKEHNKSSLLAASNLFEELLKDVRRHSWQLFYNLGNVQGALGNHEKAIHYYEAGAELDSHQPTLWKNLASTYHNAGEHEKEMRCFDKALELNPQLPEALVSKAVSLFSDFGKAEEAIPLFESSLRLAPDTVTKWPHVWYWLTMAHQQVGNQEQALQCIEEGLEQQPGDRAMRHLKSSLLEKLVLKNSGFQERAIIFWRSELAAEPRNYEARLQLIRVLADTAPVEAWQLVDETFRLMGLKDAEPLRPLGFGPLHTIEALRYLHEYGLFRAQHPLSVYRDPEDPLNFPRVTPPTNKRLDAQLLSYFAVTFGLGWHSFATSTSVVNDPNELTRLFDDMRANVLIAVKTASRVLAAELEKQRGDVEAISRSLTNALLFLTTVALREFALQRGVLMREHNVSLSARDTAMASYDENKLNTDAIGEILIAINGETHLFPD